MGKFEIDAFADGGLDARDEATCRKAKQECLQLARHYEWCRTPLTDHYAKRWRARAADWQREIDFFSQPDSKGQFCPTPAARDGQTQE